MSSLELKHREHAGSHGRWEHRGSLRLTIRGPPWKLKLFPKLICVSSLGIWASRSWERCVQEETGAKKPNSLEARTPHQCDDRFLCLFVFFIWEFQNTSQSLLRGATGAVFLVSDTWISQPQPVLVLTLWEAEMWSYTDVSWNSSPVHREAGAAAPFCWSSKRVLIPPRLRAPSACHYQSTSNCLGRIRAVGINYSSQDFWVLAGDRNETQEIENCETRGSSWTRGDGAAESLW